MPPIPQVSIADETDHYEVKPFTDEEVKEEVKEVIPLEEHEVGQQPVDALLKDEDPKNIAKFANQSYFDISKRREEIKSFKFMPSLSGQKFSVYVSNKNKEIIFSVSGTKDMYDLLTDANLSASGINLYEDRVTHLQNEASFVKEKYPQYDIIYTGHSLGGSLATSLASRDKDSVAMTFNRGGVLPILKDKQSCDRTNCGKRVVNYRIGYDPIGYLGSFTNFGPTEVINGKNINKHSLSNFVE